MNGVRGRRVRRKGVTKIYVQGIAEGVRKGELWKLFRNHGETRKIFCFCAFYKEGRS